MKLTTFLVSIGLLSSNLPLASASDVPAIHGMLLFGKEKTYLSHLPMFHPPHDYQAILEARLPAAAQAIYLHDRLAHPEQSVYTVVPETPATLPALVRAGARFRVTLYRGHFERGGTPITSGALVTVARVLHFRKLDPDGPRTDTLTYLLFGQGSECFLAHWISARPDFDQVLGVSTGPGTSCSAPQAIPVHVEGNDPTQPVTPSLPLRWTDATTGAQLVLPASSEIYLESGDLSD